MKKTYIVIISTIILIISIGTGFYYYTTRNKEKSSNKSNSNFIYNSTKVSTSENDTNTSQNSPKEELNATNTTESDSSTDGNTTDTSSENTNSNVEQQKTPHNETETQISSFKTKIYTKDSERQNNISITCSALNGTTVDSGQTFSFCNTVGKATSSKGYQKADVYKDGEVVQALGGGNCQVSSTLYNAVLKTEGLNVTERHEHSNSVPYVSKGKDAAVAYGSYDFKFINNTGNKVKINSSCDKNYVYVNLLKIE